jgi:pyridoxine 4-dehydrogenase
LVDHAAQHDIGFIPWFPLATGRLANQQSAVAKIASRLGISPSQLALAWLLKRSPTMLPIPGTSSVGHLEENTAAAEVVLSDADFAAVGAAVR